MMIGHGHEFDGQILEAGQDIAERVLSRPDEPDAQTLLVFMVEQHGRASRIMCDYRVADERARELCTK